MKTLEDFDKPPIKKPWENDGVEWREVKMKDVAIINPKKSEVRELIDKNVEVSFVPMEYVDDEQGKIVKMKIRPIKEVYKGYTYFRNDDIIFAKITPCMENGKSAVATGLKNGIGFGSTEFHVIRPKENIFSKYIFYFVRRKAYREEAAQHFTGTVGHRRVPKEFIMSSKIPLPFRNGKPDLETQRKIVEYIEANFSRIDKILERKKRELAHLDKLWESVLEQAFRPKPGEEWRKVRLGEIADIIGGGTPRRGVKDYWEGGTIPWISVKDMNSYFISDSSEYITEKAVKESATKLIPADNIIIATRVGVGKIAINFVDVAINQDLKGLILKQGILNKFLLYYFLSIDLDYYSREFTVKGILKRHLERLKIPLPFRNGKPDLEKQREIAEYLDSVYEKIKELKEKIQNQISQLEEMKESILEEVFNHG